MKGRLRRAARSRWRIISKREIPRRLVMLRCPARYPPSGAWEKVLRSWSLAISTEFELCGVAKNVGQTPFYLRLHQTGLSEANRRTRRLSVRSGMAALTLFRSFFSRFFGGFFGSFGLGVVGLINDFRCGLGLLLCDFAFGFGGFRARWRFGLY